MTVLKDENAQRRGLVLVILNEGIDMAKARRFDRRKRNLRDALPIRIVGTHLCATQEPGNKSPLEGVMPKLGMRLRFRPHFGKSCMS